MLAAFFCTSSSLLPFECGFAFLFFFFFLATSVEVLVLSLYPPVLFSTYFFIVGCWSFHRGYPGGSAKGFASRSISFEIGVIQHRSLNDPSRRHISLADTDTFA